jgi:DMSO/TMAO reductase YedYZ molybdopterin-dependent catalytic subunit
MPRRLANLVLLAAVATLLATGVVAWLLPETSAAPLFVIHRVAGLALVLGAGWKYGIARRSLHRRGLGGVPVWVGLLTAVAAIVAAGIGVAWTTGIVSFDRPLSYSALSLHVIAGLALAILVVVHALIRGERRPALVSLASRRSVLRGLGLLAASLAVSAAIDQVALARRLTGSRHAGSFTGNALPTTIWAFDLVPIIEAADWRLRIGGAAAQATEHTYTELRAMPQHELSAVLDCTGGWWSEQVWRGVNVRDLLAARGAALARQVEVVSVTGHRWTFDRSEIEQALLATHVQGEPLSAAHGYPLRLVVPGRRGFLWIKWVSELVVA